MTTLLLPRARRELKISTAPVVSVPVLPSRPDSFFTPEVHAELAQSDHEAWTAVCTILITIVSLGLVIGIGAVLLTL